MMSDETNEGEREVIDKSDLPNRGSYAIGQALPLLIFTICAIGFGSIFAVRNFMRFGGSAAVLDATAVVCGGQPSGEAAVYEASADRLHPVVVFRTLQDGRLVTDSAAVPEGWQAESAAEIELVLCVKFDRIAYRNLCNDSGGDSGLTIEYGRELVVELREARTANVIQEGLINSVTDAPPPDVCLAEQPESPPAQTAVSPENIQQWLAPFVTP